MRWSWLLIVGGLWACSEPDQKTTVIEGDLTLSLPTELQQLAGIKHITGDLQLRGQDLSGELVLEELESIDGALTVQGTGLTRISLPALQAAGAVNFSENGELSEFSLPVLAQLGQLHLWSTSANPATLILPELSTAGELTFSGNIVALGLPKLATVEQFYCDNCTSLTSLDMPQLRSLNYLFLNGADALENLSLPALQEVEIMASVRGALLRSLELPALNYADQLWVTAPSLASIDLGALEVAGDVQMGTPLLSELAFPRLTQVNRLDLGDAASDPQVSLNLLLPGLVHAGSLRLPPNLAGTLDLASLVDAGEIGIYLDFSNAARLEGLQAPALVRVGTLDLTSPVLASLSMPALTNAGSITLWAAALGCDAQALFPQLDTATSLVSFVEGNCP